MKLNKENLKVLFILILIALTSAFAGVCINELINHNRYKDYNDYKDYYNKAEKFIHELDSVYYLDDVWDTPAFDDYKHISNKLQKEIK